MTWDGRRGTFHPSAQSLSEKKKKVLASEPSQALFIGALKRICNVEPEIIDIQPPDWLKSGEPVPDDMRREMWHIKSIKR